MKRPSKRENRTQALADTFGQSEALSGMIGGRTGALPENVSVDQIVPNRYNPRQEHDPDALEELTESMRKRGFLGALDGRRLDDGRIELGYGARRLVAAQRAPLPSLPVYLHDWNDTQMLEIALIENAIRLDLTPLETATALASYQDLLRQQVERRRAAGEKTKEKEYSARTIAVLLGKGRAWVNDHLSLSQAPADVRNLVQKRPDTLRAATFIARVEKEQHRRKLEHMLLAYALTTREIQVVVQELDAGATIDDALSTATLPTPPEPAPKPLAGTEAGHAGDKTSPHAERETEKVAARAATSLPPELPYESRMALQALELLNRIHIQAGDVDEEHVLDMMTWIQQIGNRAYMLQLRLEQKMSRDAMAAMEERADEASAASAASAAGQPAADEKS